MSVRERAAAALDDDFPAVLVALRRGLENKDARKAASVAVSHVQLVYGRQLQQPADEQPADPLDVASMSREQRDALKRRILAQHPHLVTELQRRRSANGRLRSRTAWLSQRRDSCARVRARARSQVHRRAHAREQGVPPRPRTPAIARRRAGPPRRPASVGSSLALGRSALRACRDRGHGADRWSLLLTHYAGGMFWLTLKMLSGS